MTKAASNGLPVLSRRAHRFFEPLERRVFLCATAAELIARGVPAEMIHDGHISRADFARRAVRAGRARSVTPRISIDVDVEERLMDRLDPAHQLDKLSRFLWRRKQLAALRGQFMYFYTDLKQEGGKGLAGVNLNTGETQRAIRLDDLDYRFTTDEIAGLIYVAKDDRLIAYGFNQRRER